MEKPHIVTSTGFKDGKPYSVLEQLIQGTKQNGDRYCFSDDKNTIREEEEIPIGTIITYKTTRVAATK